MLELIKYRFKCKLRNKILMFWNLMFPLLLITIFGFVLINANSTPVFQTIPIAIVNNTSYQNDKMLQETVEKASVKDKKLFQVQVVEEAEAIKLLANKKVSAYILHNDNMKVYVSGNGMNATITKLFFDEYVQRKALIQRMINDGKSNDQILAVFKNTNTYIKEETTSNSNLSSIYFYAILAMETFIGGHWAIASMYELQANQSSKGMRIACAPTRKIVNMFVDLLLNLGIQIIFIAIQFAYMFGMFQVSFGEHLPFVILLLILGSIAGIGFGSVIGNLAANISVGNKANILTMFTLSASFLSGMMNTDMKFLVETKMPILSHINPVNMITDGMYALYYYGFGVRYMQNLMYLLIFAFVCYTISFLAIRKKAYPRLVVD